MIHIFEGSQYVKPPLEENKSKNWVMNGKDNCFYKHIIDRFNGSVTNSAIISSYIELIYGRGLSAKDSSQKMEQWVKLLTILKPKELKKFISDFELFGEASFQVIKTRDRKHIAEILHLPKQFVVPEIEDERGIINNYWYSRDFSSRKIEPVKYPAFGTTNEAIEIFVLRPYKAGKNYFADPDYLSGLMYAEMEEEIANFYINSIKKGLSAGFIINVPDGNVMTPEEKEAFERKMKQKLTGSSNAMTSILNFAYGDKEITVVPFPTNESVHKQWDFLSGECRQQLFTAHKVTSPMLFGVKDNTGFGNNADELDTAEAQLMKRVISPKQNHITEALKEILATDDINLDLFLMPLTELKATPIALSSVEKKNPLIELGEDFPADYELIDENEVDYQEEERIQLSSTGLAVPNARSVQDGINHIVRYKYVGNAAPERSFCKAMMSANKIYRKEDIIAMGSQNVNPGFGMHPNPNEPYSIWLYKGGGLLSDPYPSGTCKHKWNRLIFLKKGATIDVKSPLAEIISTSEARRKGLKIPTNENIVSIAPHDYRG
jgi:hypothetical protein